MYHNVSTIYNFFYTYRCNGFAHFLCLQLLVPVCLVPCQVSSLSSSKVVSRRGTDPAEVQRCFEVNVAAPLRLAQLWAQVRVEQKLGGAVVNVSSQPLELSEFPKLKGRSPGESLLCKGFSRLLQCGYTSLSGQLRSSTVVFPAHTSYSVSKAAIDQVTRHLAVELGPHQIRSNAVKPTVVRTEMGRTAWPDGAPETKDSRVDFFHLTFLM